MPPKRRWNPDGGDGVSTVGDWSVVGSQPPSPVEAEEPSLPEGAGRPSTREAVEEPSRALLRWAGFVRSFRKIRKYQRYFHNTGERLKDFSKELREGIAIAYPKR